MEPETEGILLRIYIEEQRKYKGLPLHEWITGLAQREGLAGATVLRGMEGFGRHHRLHTAKVLRLASNLPVIVEIADAPEKIEKFLALLGESLSVALVTTQKIKMRFFRRED